LKTQSPKPPGVLLVVTGHAKPLQVADKVATTVDQSDDVIDFAIVAEQLDGADLASLDPLSDDVSHRLPTIWLYGQEPVASTIAAPTPSTLARHSRPIDHRLYGQVCRRALRASRARRAPASLAEHDQLAVDVE
jgi:hypothetical protein